MAACNSGARGWPFTCGRDLVERRLVVHREVGEHLAVDLDVARFSPFMNTL